MSGRAFRARLWGPSFLVMASALACGETSSGPDGGAGAASQTVGGSAGVGGSGYAGTADPPFPMNPPLPTSCPSTPPQYGSTCSGPQRCDYSGTARNGCPE